RRLKNSYPYVNCRWKINIQTENIQRLCLSFCFFIGKIVISDPASGVLASNSRPGWEGGQLISDPIPCLPSGIRVAATAWRSRIGPINEQPKLQSTYHPLMIPTNQLNKTDTHPILMGGDVHQGRAYEERHQPTVYTPQPQSVRPLKVVFFRLKNNCFMIDARSRVIVRHSSFRFIFGFLKFIQKASRVLRADVFDSCARIRTVTSKSSPLCFAPHVHLEEFFDEIRISHLGVLLCGHKVVYPFPQYIPHRTRYMRSSI
uniref:CUB domain-containing protein n=1 Tax=Angiostrongylus cantonensis TaxID=6313 RepID=A0A0K0D4V2_ANGCA